MKKRAEMTTQQIVVLVILIASFAVILFFFSQLDLFSDSAKEICHNSVVLRDKSIGESVPLNCQREYVCITKDGSCEKMTDPVKEKVKTKEEVYQVLADELADCWWMFGEGKIDYVEKTTLPKLSCSICSQVSFDDSVKEIFEGDSFEKSKLYGYMSSANYSEETTYNYYMYDTSDLEEISQGINFGKIYLDKNYFSMIGISSGISETKWEILEGAVVGITAAVLFVPTGGTASVAALSIYAGATAVGATAGVAGGKFTAIILEGGSGKKYLRPTFVEANSQEYKDIGCDKILTKS